MPQEVENLLKILAAVVGITSVIGFLAKWTETKAGIARLFRSPRGERLEGEQPVEYAARQLHHALKEQWGKEAATRGVRDGGITISWQIGRDRLPHRLTDDAEAMKKIDAWGDASRATVDRLAEFYPAGACQGW